MNRIVIIGGKGSAVVIAEQIIDAKKRGMDVDFIGFAFDDTSYGHEINGFPILCGTKEAFTKYEKYPDVSFIFQIWRPDLIQERIKLRDGYGIPNERYATFIHPLAMVSQSAKVGFGSVVLANSVINANAVVGNHVTIQSNSLIGHDTTISDNCFIAAHCAVGSNNKVGMGCFFGLNCSLNNYLNIGDYVFVGMGSNVIKTVPDQAMVLGNPAREVERKIKPL